MSDGNIVLLDDCIEILENSTIAKNVPHAHFSGFAPGYRGADTENTRNPRRYEDQIDESFPRNIKAKKIIYFPNNGRDDDFLFTDMASGLITNIKMLLALNLSVRIYDALSIMKTIQRPPRITAKINSPIWVETYTKNKQGESGGYFAFANNKFYRGARDMAFLRRQEAKDHLQDNRANFAHLSAIEQAASTWCAEISNGSNSIILPASYKEIKDLCLLRDKSNEDRRKAILHFVNGHSKHVADKEVHVDAYLRGVETIAIDNLQLNLSPPLKQIEITESKKAENCFSRQVWECWKQKDAVLA
jgi:hypothetical protein